MTSSHSDCTCFAPDVAEDHDHDCPESLGEFVMEDWS